MSLEILARREPWSRGVELMAMTRAEGVQYYGAPLTLVKREPNEVITEPTARLRETEAQRLMDELWNCGFRPSEGTGSAGSLAATERHLRDLQAIVMGSLRKAGVL